MSTYAPDSSAAAVILYESGKSYYEASSVSYIISTEIHRKIKILKQEGVDQANVSIPFYNGSGAKVSINKLEAWVYNMENGKVAKTMLDKKYIKEEKVSQNSYLLKFTLPGVVVGSVIEYKYKIESDFWTRLPNWSFQDEYPVIKSEYEVDIPEFFIFTYNSRGFEEIGHEKKTGPHTFNFFVGGRTIQESCTITTIKFWVDNAPALKKETYVWNLDDFTSGIRFELTGTRFPGAMYKSHSQTWEDIEKTLRSSTDFILSFNGASSFKNEITQIASEAENDKQKIENIYQFIKSKIRWNKYYSFWDNNPREAIKNGTGNNAQINSLLMRSLKEAGYKPYILLLSPRTNGRLIGSPTMESLRTFVVAVNAPDGKVYYMDGSAEYGGLNILPTNLLVDMARVFNDKVEEKWVDLSRLTLSRVIRSQIVRIEEDGTIKAEISNVHTDQNAYNFRMAYSAAKDSTEYVEKLGQRLNCTIDSLAISGLDPKTRAVTESMRITKKTDTNNGLIYINPLIFTHISTNPFTQSERKLPIEFDFTNTYMISTMIFIPEGYEVEELPKPLISTLDESGGKLTYNITHEGNIINVSYKFDLNQLIFLPETYEYIKSFWGQMVEKNGEMIVLKKISKN